MVSAASMFRKSGFNDQDAATLATVAAQYQNVADTAVSAEDAASSIVSQIRAFGEDASFATHVIDAYNEVANNFSVGTNDLSQAMEVASSGMATYGNSFEQIIGLVTSGTEIMQGRSLQVARGLSTIAARIVKNQDTLKQYGIEVTKLDGSLKSTFEVLSELKPKWDSMTEAERASLGDTIAGTNQYKVLAAVMQNFSQASEASKVALNSAGSASKENEKYMESLEAKVTALKAAFQDFANRVLSNEFVGGVLKAGEVLLNFANNDVVATIAQMALLGGTALGVAGKIGQVATKLADVISKIVKAGTLGASGWGLIIGGAVAALTAIVSIIDKIKKSAEEAKHAYENLKIEISDLEDKQQSAIDRLEEIYPIPWADRTDDIRAEQLELESLIEDYKEAIALKKEEAAKEAEKTVGQYETKIYNVKSPNLAESTFTYYRDIRSAVYGLAGELNIALTDAKTGAARSIGEIKAELESLGYVFTETTSTVTLSDSELQSVMSNIANSFGEIQEKVSSGEMTYDEAQSALTGLINKYPGLVEKIQTMVSAEDDNLYSIGENSDAMHGLVDALDAVQSAMDEARNATDEASTGILSHANNWAYATKAGQNFVNIAREEQQALISEKVQASATESSIRAYTAAIINSNATKIDVAQKLAALQSLRASAINAAIAVNMVAQSKGANISSTYLDPWQRGGYGANASGYLSSSDAANLRQYYESFVTSSSSSSGGYSGGGGGSSGGSGSSEDTYLKEFELWLKAKKHALEMDEITESQYYNDLKIMNDRYFKGKDKYLEEYWKYQEEIYKYEKSQTKDNLQQQLDALSELEDAINEKYDNELSKLKDVNSELENQIEYEKLLADLAEARNKKQLVYKDGRYQYMADVDALASAKSKLDDYYRDKALQDKEAQIESRRESELSKILEQQEILNDKLKKLTGYAGGSISTGAGLSLVGENGPELRVLNSGDGIIPTSITRNLWDWGMTSPNSLSSLGNLHSGNSLSFNNVNMSFPNVHSAADANMFVQNLTNLAYQYSYSRK